MMNDQEVNELLNVFSSVELINDTTGKIVFLFNDV